MKKLREKSIDISVVTPCYNEEENVELCADDFRRIMREELPNLTYEHIFVDNNSSDKTFKILLSIAKMDERVKIIKNSRNVGSFYNMWIGMENCTGKYVVPLLPADQQDPPSHIPVMYKKLIKENALIAYGVIKKREERFTIRKAREIYYYLVSKLSDSEIPRNSGEFLIADSRVVRSVLETSDQNPYIRGLFAQTNVKSIPVPYTKVKRRYGKSKENFLTLFNAALNGFISTSILLPRVILISGLASSLIAVSMSIFNLFNFIVNGSSNTLSGIPTLLISLFFFSGLQLLFLGIATEYIQAIYRQVRPSPKSFIVNKINFN